MVTFVRRLALHYDIYRRYPLARVPALRNAWRIARAAGEPAAKWNLVA